MFRIALCLPDAAQRHAVLTLCTEYFARHIESLQVTTPTVDAAPPDADLIFFSASGPRPNGLDAAARLRRDSSRTSFVFLASGPEHAMDAFRLSALQYLVPPVSPARIFETLDRAMLRRRGPSLPLMTRLGMLRLPFAEIEYVECTDHTLHFHMLSQHVLRSTTLRVPLKQALAPLMDDERFYQPHRSYVVNLDAVALLTDTEFQMESGARVPVPRGRAAEARQAFWTVIQPLQRYCPFSEKQRFE
ncbi:MAG: LytTR family DNA-binding domain-containing protein [Faecalibacterium sp.]|jgi:DNA-binding LytR/AlgR family response regulator|nr:LytTR family DNA-binding domain-containing protein [Faecalibacterium sp.]